MAYKRLDNEIVLSDDGATNIENLLQVGDIGTNPFGTVFTFRDPVHKEEFLNLCNKLYYKCDLGYILFASKGDDKKWHSNYLD